MPTNILKTAKRQVEISGYTYFGLPGKVAYLIETAKPEELKQIILAAKKAKLPYFILAGGSNIVVSNKKYPGLVIVYRHFSPVVIPAQAGSPGLRATSVDEIHVKGNNIECPASICLGDVINLSISRGLAGLESFSGIPGTIGGAVFGNAGAYGHSIAEVVEKVLIFNGRKEIWLTKKECQFSYRDSIFKKKTWAILAVQLKLKPGSRDKLRAYAKSLISQRAKKYANIKCPGSFFKNVLVTKVTKKSLTKIDQTKIIAGKIPAGYLLESVGAKGRRVGGLRIADYHGNLLINDGSATFRDVQKLVAILQAKVKAQFGIKLEEEVRYLI